MRLTLGWSESSEQKARKVAEKGEGTRVDNFLIPVGISS